MYSVYFIDINLSEIMQTCTIYKIFMWWKLIVAAIDVDETSKKQEPIPNKKILNNKDQVVFFLK